MAKANILIVEDERIVAMDIRNSLEALGYTIAGHADRGEDAVQKAMTLHPDLILMDIVLKGEMDGIQAAEQIQKHSNVPLIFLTAFSDQATLERARVTEPFGFIVKPFDERDLASNIEMALYKHNLDSKLRESENKFRSVIEYASDGMALISPQGLVIEWNPALEQITGLKRTDLIDQPIWEVSFQMLPKASRTQERQEAFTHQWKLEAQNGYVNKDHMVQYEIERPDGICRIVESNGFTIETTRGTLGGVIMRDITERHQIEQALREKEERLRVITENAPSIIVEVDAQGRILYMSRVLPGYRREDVLGKHVTEWIAPEYKPVMQQVFERVLSEGTTQSYESYAAGEHGEMRWYLSNLAPVYVNGQIKSVIVVSTDISEHKLAELEILGTQNQLKATLEAIPDLIFELGLDGRYHSYHSPRNDLLAAPPEVFLGKTITEILPAAVADVVMTSILEANEKELSIGRQFELQLPQGLFWFELSVSRKPILPGEEPRFIVLSRDITARKKAEIDIGNLLAELKTKNTELEQFTYTVSHDLKAPLVTISGFLGYLEKDVQAGNSERIRSDIQRITDAIEKMQRLLNELLELSRIGRLANPLQLVSLDLIAHDAVELVAGRIAEKGVNVDIAPDLPVINCDRTRLTQVLQNLLDNAVKFMGDQPSPRIEINQRKEDHNLVFFVRDNGIGIPPEHHARVFGLFDKLDSKAEGTGIGLALVKRIVEVHGGKIWVESEGLGKGSTFCFTIPQ